MEWVIGCVVGIGLAAAAGFRLFVPLLGLSLAYTLDWMEPSAAFHWLDSWIAVTALGVATVVEIGAFYVPWLDHLLDVAVAPLSVVAGTLLMASSMGDSSPALQWGLSIVAGGGVAAAVQAGTTATRGVSGVTTGGLANPIVSTFELLGGHDGARAGGSRLGSRTLRGVARAALPRLVQAEAQQGSARYLSRWQFSEMAASASRWAQSSSGTKVFPVVR